MKKGTKIGFSIAAVALGTVLLSSCTQSFCSQLDIARMKFAFEPGITRFEADENATHDIIFEEEGYTYTIQNAKLNVATWNEEKKTFAFYTGGEETFNLRYLNALLKDSRSKGYLTIDGNSVNYMVKFDYLAYHRMLVTAAKANQGDITLDLSKPEDVAILSNHISTYSYLRFANGNYGNAWGLWNRYDTDARKAFADVVELSGANNYLVTSGMFDNTEIGVLSPDVCPSKDFIACYRTYVNTRVAYYRTCLTTKTDKYGTYGYSSQGGEFIGLDDNKQVYISGKTWGEAWSKGLFEGLLVYPIGWLVDSLVIGFGSTGVSNGVAAFLGIFFVTLIIRGLMLLATFKQTQSNAKMTELQPEIQKIQNKYPNANTSQAEKQRMAEEMNRLYKKNKVNPFMTIIVLIVQFPVFICVWGALSGSAALTNGTILGLNLSYTIKDVLFTASAWTEAGGYAAVTALMLFLLMALAQTLSMLLPQWIQKRKAKDVAKLGKNPAQKSQANKMKWFTYIMLALIIFMGFSLVSAMGIYWFVGALFSIAQTLIIEFISKRKKAKKA